MGGEIVWVCLVCLSGRLGDEKEPEQVLECYIGSLGVPESYRMNGLERSFLSARIWVEGDRLEAWYEETMSSQVGQRWGLRCEPCWDMLVGRLPPTPNGSQLAECGVWRHLSPLRTSILLREECWHKLVI